MYNNKDAMTKNPKIMSTRELLEHYQGKFLIPDFQRDYVWTTDQWNQLWNDLVELSDDDQHFMGGLTIQKCGDETYNVLDGQQRLTTLMVLVDVLEAKEGIQAAKKGKLGSLFSKESGVHVLNADLLRESDGEKEKRDSAKEKKYRDIFENFVKKYALANYPDREMLKSKLMDRFFWLIDELSANDDKHVAFEQLNATGKALTYADFLLSYLLDRNALNDKLDSGQVKKEWQNILESVSTQSMVFEDDARVTENEDESQEVENSYNHENDDQYSGEEDKSHDERENEESDKEKKEAILRPLKLKKFLNALRGVALIWPENVPETIESFQKTMSLLCGKESDELTASEILDTLKKWLKVYLALVNPLDVSCKEKAYEMERYYLSTLHNTNYLPMTMRVLYKDIIENENKEAENEEAENEVKAIFGAVVRFSLYHKIYIFRNGSGMKNCQKKVIMLDYILDAISNCEKSDMQYILGVILGSEKWELTEEIFKKVPYSSSVSKVILCIDYEKNRKKAQSIPEFERDENVGRFQVEHMVARNLQTRDGWQYGYNVTTINSLYNLILLENGLNNSLNNKAPEYKYADETNGWTKSALYENEYFFGDEGMFPTEGLKKRYEQMKNEENELEKVDLYVAQEERVNKLWNSFKEYMSTPKQIAFGDKVPYKVLWMIKKYGVNHNFERESRRVENYNSIGNKVLYFLDERCNLKEEKQDAQGVKKANKKVQNFYFNVPDSQDEELKKYQDMISFGKDGIDKASKEAESIRELKFVGEIFFTLFAPMKETKSDYSSLSEYVKKLDPKHDASLYRMLACGPESELEKHDTRVATWVQLPNSVSEDIQHTVWLNQNFDALAYLKNLRKIYKEWGEIRAGKFGYWVELEEAHIQIVGNNLVYSRFFNIGDETEYLSFLKETVGKPLTDDDTRESGPDHELNRWFNVEKKTLKELLNESLSIPEYQRSYVWNEQNWEDLLNYISTNKNKDSITCGTVILHKKDGSNCVVDGQQRLTTFANFWKWCDKGHIPQGLNKREEIMSYLDKLPDEKKKEYKALLSDCLEKISFSVLNLNTKNTTCPYQVFASINGKGKKLTVEEKVKNYLFAFKKDGKKGADYRKIINDCTQNTRYIKAWVEMQKKRDISEDNLYYVFREIINHEAQKIDEFFDAYDHFKKYFVNIHHRNSEDDSGLRTELLFYRSLNVTTGDALILGWILNSLNSKDNDNDTLTGKIKKLTGKIKKLNTLYFLLYVMDLGGNDKKSINSKLPKLIDKQDLTIKMDWDGENKKWKTVLLNESISSNKESIELIWDNYVCAYDLGSARKDVARFLLLSIERWLGLNNNIDLYLTMHSDPKKKENYITDVEHIHPISQPDSKLKMNCLENICLLETGINRVISAGKMFDDSLKNTKLVCERDGKKLCYADSELMMPKMFYSGDGKPRWYNKDGVYGIEEAKSRMKEIRKKVVEEEKSLFETDIKSILPKETGSEE